MGSGIPLYTEPSFAPSGLLAPIVQPGSRGLDILPPLCGCRSDATLPPMPAPETLAPGLYLVATPIGNLEDITLHAIRVLKQVDLIACEDTRQTQNLLNHFGIEKPTMSYHEHNEASRAAKLIEKLAQGARIAVVSDAGTPGVSDPGFRLVSLAIERGIPVVPIPGPAAFVSALVASGLPVESFNFRGFLPPKSGARRREFGNPNIRKSSTKHRTAFAKPSKTSSLFSDPSARLSSRAS